ncbi:OmpH family outer membrane protein [Sphingomonas suaedae]|uniref:OmpH family outer membrane protein n=1 Tax=Sphingomonas suaedae TaxID=2599297 RepID=A0A518RDH4_9SPHN|nr:OmpH family outer membrane protein [Sphingomonas suaedae]QDX25431.1 OmpH family outer membrane protein [Sphingomonas suaedae]
MRNTKTLLAAIAVAGVTFGAGAATAQALADAKVATVDTERVMRECAACVVANQQLQTQLTQLQQFAQQQGAPLQTEEQTLQAALKAANGKPDAALTQRIQAFQTRQDAAQRQVNERQSVFQRNVQYVRQQIAEKMVPAVEQVSKQRGATVALDRGNVLFAAPTVDITAQVLSTLNQQLPSVNTVAPPPQQPAQQPAQQPTQPAPTGR